NGGYVNYCVSSGYTAYCSYYDENGKCTGRGSCSSTPYVSEYYEDGNPKRGSCCSGTPYKFDFVRVCVVSGRIPYCTTYNADGKCTAATTSLVKDCKPYRKSATEGACCAGTLIDGLAYPICSNRL
ncbi:MAG: hypothetical protein IJC30_02625, partial [Alphaproteobacteria bacterium]|nr:hypothetical protein [Alphaproteobacteria bacterium]